MKTIELDKGSAKYTLQQINSNYCFVVQNFMMSRSLYYIREFCPAYSVCLYECVLFDKDSFMNLCCFLQSLIFKLYKKLIIFFDIFQDL